MLRSNPAAHAPLTVTPPARRGHRWVTAVAASVLAVALAAPAAEAATASPTNRVDTTAALTTTSPYPWYSVEQYYLFLVNCTRSGGWVLSSGECRGWGSSRYSPYVKPLLYSTRISNLVTRPYAKLLATRGICSHFADHDPGYRLRRAGYARPTWGENIGCRDGYSTAKAAVLASHLKFQSEKATNGGHWRNMKNPRYLYIAIGVWRYGTRTRLVTDFYG